MVRVLARSAHCTADVGSEIVCPTGYTPLAPLTAPTVALTLTGCQCSLRVATVAEIVAGAGLDRLVWAGSDDP